LRGFKNLFYKPNLDLVELKFCDISVADNFLPYILIKPILPFINPLCPFLDERYKKSFLKAVEVVVAVEVDHGPPAQVLVDTNGFN
jgi:hypothetical protein